MAKSNNQPGSVSPAFSRGDLLGPLTAAAVSLPIEVSYGIVAFSPLGAQALTLGAIAALYCAIFANLAAAIAGTRTGLLAGTRPALVLAVAVLVGQLLTQFQASDSPGTVQILALLMLTVFLAGFLQFLMGLLRIGRLFKYIPYPVLAGFVNAAALLIFLSALRPFIGLPNATSFSGFWNELTHASPGGLVVSGASLMLALFSPRLTTRLPALLVAILGGLLLHHLISFLFPALPMGHTLNAVVPRWPDADPLRHAVRMAQDGALYAQLLPTALTLALLGTVETMLTSSVIDGRGITGHQSADRELLAQGVANMASSCVGGLPSAAGVSRCNCNVGGGARTRWAALAYAGIAVLVLLGAQGFRWMPFSVLGGVMIAVAWGMLDDWSRRTPRQLIADPGMTRAQRRTLLSNYLVMLTVVATALIADLVTAVFVGVLGAMLLFVRQNSRNIIRRQLDGGMVHSHRQRSISRMRELEREGHRIVLLELEGALFFGTADKLSREIEARSRHADFLILDFRRVTDIDVTGARLLRQAVRTAADQRCQLLMAGIRPEGGRGSLLGVTGDDPLLARSCWFDNMDDALEWAEDALLEKFDLPEQASRRMGIEETQLGRGLRPEERACLWSYLDEILITKDAPLFRSGDAADSLFVLVYGNVSIMLNDEHGRRRVASFAPGVIFGEMGLLDGQPRSADVYADDAAIVLKLARTHFDKLLVEHPAIAARLLMNLGVEMATRLRFTNQSLQTGDTVRRRPS